MGRRTYFNRLMRSIKDGKKFREEHSRRCFRSPTGIVSLKDLILRKEKDNVKMLLEGSELTKDEHESQLYDDFEHFHQKKEKPFTNTSKVITCKCTHPKRPQNSEYFKDKMLLMQAQENGVVLDEEQLLFIAGGQDSTFDDDVDQVFEADQCDDFDSDVDEALTAQTMFMVNLSSTDLIYDEAGLSYDSEILSEVQDHDNYLDNVEDTLESAEITRKRMLEKMKSPLWFKNKIKIAPLGYSKENYLATFTPQRQLSAV
ncbi:hypothetical protein Tco_1031706 [Tanacetum coccineum]|uniref:Uncharacterized protein n=1 Tax=Tanacetum coccineum TaxID=301880 RepID=A0ABQ5GB85_9ASTR